MNPAEPSGPTEPTERSGAASEVRATRPAAVADPAAATDAAGPVVERLAAHRWPEAAELRARFLAEVRGTTPARLPTSFLNADQRYVRHAMADGRHRVWVARDGGRAVGHVALAVADLPPRPEDLRTAEATVVALWVDPGHRRRGLGQALLGACLAEAQATGIRRLQLQATDAGRPLYEQAGFGPVDRHLALDIDPR